MKIAIVHDYIKEFGGAERVLLELHKLYPDAPVYTSLYAPKYLGPHAPAFKNMKVRTSFLQFIPFKEKLISIFRIISPFVFMSFNLSDFDVIIVSQTGAYFPSLVNKGSAKLICYTHTPPRYLYGYMTAREWQKDRLMKFFGTIANHFLRMTDYRSSQNVDYFIANSLEVKARIKKFYRRDAVVIYPPVETSHDLGKITKKDYFLAGGRLARAKGIDIIINAFIKNKKPIKIFGKGFAGFEDELLEKIKGKITNVEFVGEVDDREKISLMREAKAYVFASFDEDFGITPVEAQSVGTPVIAFKSGGVKETVIDGKTGVFYEKNNSEELVEAIKRFEKKRFSQEACKKQAEKFSSKNFDKKIKDFVKMYA